MTSNSPLTIDELNNNSNSNNSNSPGSRPASIRRVRRTKDTLGNSQPNSRPSSRPSSRPASRPVSPTGMNYIGNGEPVNSSSGDDQVIPTAIVIKNIPFSVKKDALLAKLQSMDVPAAYAFNYHFDNGVFRGLAFANYRTPEETEIVVNTINGLEIGGRKLRVEYKRVLLPTPSSSAIPHSSSTSSLSQPSSPHMSERRLPNNPDEDTLDLNDPNVLELYSFLLLFRGDPNTTEIALSKTLSAKERRDAHLIADRLGLMHYSEGFGPDRQVIIEKRGSIPAPIVRLQNKNSRGNLRSSPSRDRLNNLVNESTGSSGSNSPKRDSYRKSMMSTSTTAEVINTQQQQQQQQQNSGIIHPIRQPRGPEPGKNFASRNKSVINESNVDQLSEALSRQHLTTQIGA